MSAFAVQIPQFKQASTNTEMSAPSQDGQFISISGNRQAWQSNELGLQLILVGRPMLDNKDIDAETLSRAYKKAGASALDKLTGHFALVLRDDQTGTVIAMTDKMATVNLYYGLMQGHLYIATSLAELKQQLGSSLKLCSQSLYHYVYFHCIPSPNTIYDGVHKLEPSTRLTFDNGKLDTRLYWRPIFCDASASISVEEKYQQLRDALSDATRDFADRDGVGAFLSGGLDSSAVTAYLAMNSQSFGRQANTFTIGFSEPGYDEKAFAQAVADQYGTRHHVYDVTPKDIYEYLPQIANYYDEPFGNSSALPTFFCAKFAKENGMDILLAGDGGDELFAGNERYAKQKVFERYLALPGLAQGAMNALVPAAANVLPLGVLQKARSYISQANVRLPERLQHYNFLNQVEGSQVFNSSFINTVDTGLPLRQLQNQYHAISDAHVVDNMLYLDWKFTLADNDLMKVNYMTQMAGISVKYPMLSESLLQMACELPADVKLPGSELRDFYKKAMAGVLPDSTINKSKKGFGLPFGKWLVNDKSLQQMANQALENLKQRDIFLPDFINKAQQMHQDVHAHYYGELVWIMIMLELWLQKHDF